MAQLLHSSGVRGVLRSSPDRVAPMTNFSPHTPSPGSVPHGAMVDTNVRDRLRRRLGPVLLCTSLVGCREGERNEDPEDKGRNSGVPCDQYLAVGDLLINELVARNEGVWVDETGATDDFLEIVNASERKIDLWDVAVSDSSGRYGLPQQTLAPGGRLILWADNDVDEGPLHLPFKLSSRGESIALVSCDRTIDKLTYPALIENESYARFPDARGDAAVCRYATPNASNGDSCQPPLAKGLTNIESFKKFNWPGPHPELPRPLALSELALRPASFIEIENTSEGSIQLNGHTLSIAPLYPGEELPSADVGESIALPDLALTAGQHLSLQVTEAQVAALSNDPLFEGIVSLFDKDGTALDRVDFMRWPEGAALTRPFQAPERTVFCEETTPDAENECTMLESRDVGDRVRALRTQSDFSALAMGGTELSTESVKIVVDGVQGNRTHLLSALKWPLHYTFIREVVERRPPLDRCDPQENAEFNDGWYDFSVKEYFSTVGRSYFLGTLVHHGATGHQTVEFTPGDEILGADMRDNFFTMVGHTLDPSNWWLRPLDEEQVQKILPYEGELPLLPTDAPFSDLIYQPLTQGKGYGVLTFVSARDLSSASLGSQIILVTDDVPNDIPLTGGLITQAFQTPLAHVNLLSQNRGTPNMALRNALLDERISSNLGKMVRLSVEGDDFQITEADPDEAQAFWESRRPSGDLKIPRLDTSVRNLVDLAEANLDWTPIIGAKASQLAELYRVLDDAPSLCASARSFSPPVDAFAVPVVYFLEHFDASGARALLAELSETADFQSDPIKRAEGLAEVRALIEEEPVDPDLLDDLTREIEARFGNQRVRLRSSSNAEDLPGFTGAGLYQSESAELDDESRSVEDALVKVWASLMSARAYDERQLALIDHNAVSMGVLVHEAFLNERANGVAVSRNVLDPIRGDIYYANAQTGEASVTNPAPGVTTEEFTFQWPPRTPRLAYQSFSSLLDGKPVLSGTEIDSVACALFNIHEHFAPLVDPEGTNPWFAMEMEFKFIGSKRELVIKQARPHTFSGYEVVSDCREL